ncbi:hypothetical protein BJ912DRAFT_167130 [Pholiota molesta]|nr:hypothetical protein BJ912DRAFT_167130 [Pholiota molesta]
MPAPRVNSPHSSIGAALACYFSGCLHLLSISITLKALELSGRVVASILALMAVSDRGVRRAAQPTKQAHCDITHQEEIRDSVYELHEKVQLRSLAGEDQLNEHGLEDDDEDDEGDIELEKLSQLCEHTTAAEQHVSRWGAVPGSEERGKNKMEYADSPDSPHVGQMDTSDILDDMSSVEYGTGMLFRPFASNGAHARTVTPARSGDSIASDDPFLPPGLGPLALSLSPLPTFSTCIQPGSAAASSSRSRMSFALLTNDMMDSVGRERGVDIKASPTELMKARPRASRFGRETCGEESVDPPVKANTIATTDVSLIPFSPTQAGANITCDAKAIITKSKTNTPTQIYRALSTLSFWTPAPKIAVTIAPPVKRRRGGRRRDREKNKEYESESTSRDVFGERMLLQPMGEK